jgi:hypothetical protein
VQVTTYRAKSQKPTPWYEGAAFILRVQTHTGAHSLCERCAKHPTITIAVWDDHFRPEWDSAGRVRLTCEVRHGGEVIFPKGQLYCAVHGASDGIRARELILSLVAMHPSDGNGVGDDFYEGYSPEQLEWVEAHGEEIDCVRMDRYCDPETGACRSDS